MENSIINFIENWQDNNDYFNMLALLSSLSKLFSESSTPYLDYRITENLFCKYFEAINDSRSCTAYDARIGNLGVGIKTFGIKSASVEKIAEFNKLKPKLDQYSGKDLARALASFRNDRIEFANEIYNINDSIYHIVGRCDGGLNIFNTSYKTIDINDIHEVKDKGSTISFVSGEDFYSFNKSKSVLMKRFILPEHFKHIPIEIIDDPLLLLSELLDHKTPVIENKTKTKGLDYVVLPLYSTRGGVHVPERSGLNQWNARGRSRNENEVYIPVPAIIHQKFPDFFPSHEITFVLQLPDGNLMSAKMCQQGDKGLMSNPNSALGEWILRKVLKKRPGELVTINDLNTFGIDSVLVEKTHKMNEEGKEIYSISFTSSSYENYQDFLDK
ncbi:MAG: NgoFVII family restriction endonuclease [Bacteroidales bacterium]|nr:NgoFVII family restriction endonuclease [Bacteroidales bacterium]